MNFNKYSKWQLLHKAYLFEQHYGKPPVAMDTLIEEDLPSQSIYQNRFGSWNNFLREYERYKKEEGGCD